MSNDADEVVVLFRNSAVDTKEVTHISEEEEAYRKEITDLGFMSLLEKMKLDRRLKIAEQLFPSFSSEDMKIWAAFLPNMQYVKDYDFDNPPITVLQAIKDATELKLFDSIVVLDPRGNTAKEIFWNFVSTTEKNIDPIAFGVINTPNGQQWHPIVRWGESKLLSFDEVKRFVDKTKMNLLFRYVGALPGLTISMAILSTTFIHFLSHDTLGPILSIITTLGALVYVVLIAIIAFAALDTIQKFSMPPRINHRFGSSSKAVVGL